MNSIRKLLFLVFLSICILWQSFWEEKSWSSFWNSPTSVLDKVAESVNKDKIQDNAINDISNIQWQYASEYKIANTLDAIRLQINPYIQRIMYLWLSWAVILVIYNGLLMVTNSLHGAWEFWAVQKRLMNIWIGVWILSWFYIIIQFGLSLILYILE